MADVAIVIVILFAWHILQGLWVAGMKLFGSYTFGNLVSLGMLGLIGIVLFDIGERATPLLASAVKKSYKGKRVLDWDELAKTITSIVVFVAVWLLLASPFGSLASALQQLINPGIMRLGYLLMFMLAMAYYALTGAIGSKVPRFKEPEALGAISWDGLEQAVTMSRYLKRLEALKSSGDIDDRTYDKLRMEYEAKLREAIELP